MLFFEMIILCYYCRVELFCMQECWKNENCKAFSINEETEKCEFGNLVEYVNHPNNGRKVHALHGTVPKPGTNN